MAEIKRRYRIAAIQMDTRADKDKNLADLAALIDQAAEQNVALISLPEVFNVIPQEGVEAESIQGPTVELLQKKAMEHSVYIHGGSFLLSEDGEKPTNTTFLFNPQGEMIARYDKLHLYDVTLPDGSTRGESDRVTKGSQIVNVDTELGNLGLSICYDVRFPELYRLLTINGAKVLFIPANFMMLTGKDHWEVLLRTRAIENGCYVIAAAQMGRKKDNQDSFGASMIIDPWGTVVAKSPDRVGVIVAEIDLDYVDEVRAMIPNLDHRRSDVYSLTAK